MPHARIQSRREEMAARIMSGLRGSGAESYRTTEEPVLRERIDRLISAFIEALRDGPCRFVEYVHELAVARIGEGYLLRELQRALNLLGEEAWRVTAENAGEVAETVRRLALVSGTIGYAKDQLARDYLEQKERAEAALQERRAGQLARGTESSELGDELPSR